MSEGTATLNLGADPADLRRAFGEIVASAKKVNADLISDAKKASSEMKKTLRDQVRENNQAAGAIRRVRRTATNQTVTEEKTASGQIIRHYRMRVSAHQRATDDHKRLIESLGQVHVRVEQMKTARTLSEVYKRIQAEDRAFSRSQQRARTGGGSHWSSLRGGGRGTVSSVTGSMSANIGGGVRSFASQFHNERQQARRSHAEAISGLYTLGRQTGASASETGQYARMFESAAIEMGVPLDVLVQGAERAQTEFSSLAGGNSQARRGRMTQFLSNARLARNYSGTGAIGEATRVAGLLSNIGGSSEMQQNTLLSLMRLGELGAIELSSVSRQAMSPLMNRIGQAQGRGASVQDQHNMLIQGMAELEVLRGTGGYNPRNAGNIMANIGTALNRDTTQSRMLHNIRNSSLSRDRRRTIENALFENGHLRSNLAADPLAFISAAGQAFGNDRTAFGNLFAGHGRGDPQSLQANWRTLAGAFFNTSEGANGRMETGFDRVRRFMGEAQQPTSPQEMQRRRELAEADPQTQVIREEETRRNEMVRNTGALGRLSDAFERWSANNPLGAMAMNAAGQALGGGIIARLSGFSFGGAAGGTGAAGAATGGGASALGGIRAGGPIGAAIALTMGAATYFINRDETAETGVGLGERAGATWSGGSRETAVRNRIARNIEQRNLTNHITRLAGGDEGADARAGATFDSMFAPTAITPGARVQGSTGGTPPTINLSQDSLTRLAVELRRVPMQVQIDPHDVDHSASQGASAGRQGAQ